MRFNFTGVCKFNDESSKNPSIRSGKTAKGGSYVSGGFGISANSSTAWVEGFSMTKDTIKTMDSDGNAIEVDWDDRFDDGVIDSVASYKRFVANIGDERKTFITFADLIKYLDEVGVNGKTVTVTGTTNANIYKGAISNRFQVQNVYLADENAKPKLSVSDVLYFNKDSFDTTDWSSEHKLIINGWINAFIDKNSLGADKGANKYIPLTVIFDCSKINWDDERHVKLVKFKLKQIGCDLVDGKIKVGIKKNVYKMSVTMSYINGAEAMDVTYDMLSDNQKMAVDLGVKTLEDFKEKVFGNRVTAYKLVDFDLRGDYSDGCVNTDLTDDEFEENIFAPAEEENIDDVIKKSEKKSKIEEDDEEDSEDFDLFS